MSRINLIPASEGIRDAVKELYAYQTGELKPLSTGNSFIDEVTGGGFRRGEKYTFAALSGSGKTHQLQRIEEHIIENYGDDVALVRFSYEMSIFSLFLRELKAKLGLPMREIQSREFTEEEKKVATSVRKKMSQDNIMYQLVALDPEEFETAVKMVYEKFKDKKYIIISIDHVSLTPTENGNQGAVIQELCKRINDTSKVYPNLIFILLSQLNRKMLERTNPADMIPNVGDIYYSSTIEHLSDYIFVRHIPFKKLGKERYGSFNRKFFDYISEHFVPSESDYANCYTPNRVFIHCLKARTDPEEIPTVAVEAYNPNIPFDDLNEYEDNNSEDIIDL